MKDLEQRYFGSPGQESMWDRIDTKVDSLDSPTATPDTMRCVAL